MNFGTKTQYLKTHEALKKCSKDNKITAMFIFNISQEIQIIYNGLITSEVLVDYKLFLISEFEKKIQLLKGFNVNCNKDLIALIEAYELQLKKFKKQFNKAK